MQDRQWKQQYIVEVFILLKYSYYYYYYYYYYYSQFYTAY